MSEDMAVTSSLPECHVLCLAQAMQFLLHWFSIIFVFEMFYLFSENFTYVLTIFSLPPVPPSPSPSSLAIQLHVLVSFKRQKKKSYKKPWIAIRIGNPVSRACPRVWLIQPCHCIKGQGFSLSQELLQIASVLGMRLCVYFPSSVIYVSCIKCITKLI